MADRDLAAALARMRELGFRCFDLFALENMGHVWPSRLTETAAAKVAQTTRESGMRVSSVNSGFSVPLNDPDPDAGRQLEREFLAVLRLAEQVEAPLLTLQTGGYGKLVGKVEGFDRALEGLERACDLVQGKEIRLSFEPHWGAVVERPADALYMVRKLWPAVGITYDPSHFAMQDDIESLAETATLLDYTIHVHVRNAAPGEMQASMEEGTVDFPWLVDALRKRSYAGAVAIEYLEAAEADAVKLRDALLELGLTL
jgi:sugar phosphate isomerase/epimerase